MGATCAGTALTTISHGASMTTDASPFAALVGAQFLVLTTFRQNGEAVPTTVWFAERDGKLYITTGAEAGKLKRIRSTPRVTLAPSDRVGVVTDAAVTAMAREARPAEHAIAEEGARREVWQAASRAPYHWPLPRNLHASRRDAREIGAALRLPGCALGR